MGRAYHVVDPACKSGINGCKDPLARGHPNHAFGRPTPGETIANYRADVNSEARSAVFAAADYRAEGLGSVLGRQERGPAFLGSGVWPSEPRSGAASALRANQKRHQNALGLARHAQLRRRRHVPKFGMAQRRSDCGPGGGMFASGGAD